jgi:hypothetical protein
MKKNLSVEDRIIRFVLFDMLLGVSFLGFEIPEIFHMISFVLSIYLLFTIITGYSIFYQILGISTRIPERKKKTI